MDSATTRLLNWARANPKEFDAVAVQMGYFDQRDVDEKVAAATLDADAWHMSREMWGDNPNQPRNFAATARSIPRATSEIRERHGFENT